MRSKFPFLFIGQVLVFFSLFSCSIEKSSKQATSSLKKSELVVSHGDFILNNFAFFNMIVGSDSLLTYDQRSEKFVLFNLSSKKPIGDYNAKVEGPNFVDFPIYDINIEGGKIYALSKLFFSIYTLEGDIIERYDSKDIKGLNSDFMITEFELIDSKSVIFNKVPMQGIIGGLKSNLRPNIFCLLDLKTRSTNDLEIYSPKEALIDNTDLGYYNDFAFHNMTYKNDSIIYSFAFSSNIYTSQIRNSKTSIYSTKSELTENERKPTNPNVLKSAEWMKYVFSGPKFSALSRDDKTGNYARVHSEFKLLPNGKNYNFKYLMIMNSKFEVLNEIEIEERIIEPAIFSNGKIYLKKTDQTQEDAFQFIVYEIINN
jgi:hypothetical protein